MNLETGPFTHDDDPLNGFRDASIAQTTLTQQVYDAGEQAKGFIESPLGKVLQAMANKTIQDAQDALVQVPPTDAVEIMRLQSNAKCAAMALSWLQNSITSGKAAEIELVQKEARHDYDD